MDNTALPAEITKLLLCVYIILDSINTIWHYKLFQDGNILSAANIKYTFQFDKILASNKPCAMLYRLFFGYRSFMIIAVVRLTLAILQLFCIIDPKFFVFLFLIQIVIYFRGQIYLDLADKFSLIVIFGVSIFYNFESSLVKESSLCFIAVMSIMLYFFTSISKLRSSSWTQGKALLTVMNTNSYGNKAFSRYLRNNPKITSALTYGIITFQLISPLSVVSVSFAQLFVFFGIIFHLSISMAMNLNSFFWVMISTYPCILFVSNKINSFYITF